METKTAIGHTLLAAIGFVHVGCTQESTAPASHTTHTYDAAADFSSTSNTDSSRWSYRYQNGSSGVGAYSVIPAFGPDVVDRWTPTDPGAWRVDGYLPGLGVNRSGADATIDDATIGTLVTWQKGTMLVHPGPNLPVVLSWLSPSDATITIGFSFASAHIAPCAPGDGVGWRVELNGSATTLRSGSIDRGGDTGPQTLAGVRPAVADGFSACVNAIALEWGGACKVWSFDPSGPFSAQLKGSYPYADLSNPHCIPFVHRNMPGSCKLVATATLNADS